jgi:hypothetical protein
LDPRPAHGPEDKIGGVFAQATTLVPRRASDVAGVLTDPRHRWSVPLDGDGETLLARVGVSIAGVSRRWMTSSAGCQVP